MASATIILFSRDPKQVARLSRWSHRNLGGLIHHTRADDLFAELRSLQASHARIFIVLDASHPDAPRVAAPYKDSSDVRLIVWTRGATRLAPMWWSMVDLRMDPPYQLDVLLRYVYEHLDSTSPSAGIHRAVRLRSGRLGSPKAHHTPTPDDHTPWAAGRLNARPRRALRQGLGKGRVSAIRTPRNPTTRSRITYPKSEQAPQQQHQGTTAAIHTPESRPKTEPPRLGKLQDMPMAELLCRLFEHSLSGVLVIWYAGDERHIEFRSGYPISASSAKNLAPLGELLVELGFLEQEELERILRTKAHKGSTRLGQQLKRLQMLTDRELSHVLQLQTQRRILACFDDPNALYTFKRRSHRVRLGPRASRRDINPVTLVAKHLAQTQQPHTTIAQSLGSILEPTWRFKAFLPLLQEHFGDALPASWWARLEPGGMYSSILEGLKQSETKAARDALALMKAISAINERRAPVTAPSKPGGSDDKVVFENGACVAGRYQILGILGRGSTATVYRALDLEINETCALKVLQMTNLRRRFKQELAISRKLNHPNIIRIYDIGQDGKHHFLSMEHLEGRTLRALIDIRQQLSIACGISLLRQIVEGLTAAHEAGVIHRDLKPANVFITYNDTLKLMDFGLAKVHQQGMTRAGFRAGSPIYIAPEQIQSFRDVTSAADYYALGVVAYEMFTGKPPFTATDLKSLLLDHLSTEPDPPKNRRPDLPQPLNDLILELLVKNATERLSNGPKVLARLDAIAESL
ncbi:MAG: protein kinase [Myxococcota bacterium]